MADEQHSWPDKVAQIRSHGPLAMELYVVLTEPADGLDAVIANTPAHLGYQKMLEKQGIMFGAGPFATDDGKTWEGHGMVIIRAESLALAHAIAAADPMHASGARTFRVRPWLLNEGSLNVRLTYSDGGREIS